MGLDLDELRQEHARLENQGNNGNFLDNFFRMGEGDGIYIIRILPPKQGQKLFCLTRTHRLGEKNIHCPQTLINGKWQGLCPICNHYRNLWKQSESASPEEAEKLVAEARAIKPLERSYYNILVRSWTNPKTGETEKDKGPLIWSAGKTLHARVLRAILGNIELQEDPLGDITDPQTGRDFRLVKRMKKSGRDSFPNYDDSKFLNPSPLGTDKQVKQWMEGLHDLQALRQVKPTSELQRELDIFKGLIEDDGAFNNSSPAREEKIIVPAVVKKPIHQVDESMIDEDFLNELKNM